jgi:hypothetical protein
VSGAKRSAAISRPPASWCRAVDAAHHQRNRPFPPPRCPPTLVEQSGHFRGGVHRLGAGESGHQGGGVHRLDTASASESCAECERVRAVSRADRRGARPGSQRHGHLAGPRRRSRLHRSVCERAPLCRDAPRDVVGGGARRDHDRSWRGSPGRLRRWSDGPSSRDGQVSAHAALRPDPRLLTQSGPPAGVAVEHADLGRAPRTRLSSARRHGPRHRPR